jgi:hypothetical protein
MVKVNRKLDQIIKQVTKSGQAKNSSLVIPKRHMVRLFARDSNYFDDYERVMLNLLVSDVGKGTDVILKSEMSCSNSVLLHDMTRPGKGRTIGM